MPSDLFQFAGYYMAKEKGFYQEVGFDVDIKKFTYDTDIIKDVLSGETTYGVGRSSLIWYYSQGKEISILSAIFQFSPLVLIALESSNINSIKDFNSKSVMITQDAVETVSINALIRSAESNINNMQFKKHTFNIEDLIDKKVDLYSGYLSNEPYILKKRGIGFKIFSPKERGFDFYGDILFTSQKEAQKNPKRVEKFKNASIKGWKYAFENIDEAVDIIYEKYNGANKTKNALRFEALELKKLSYIYGVPFGSIEKNKIERILDVYRIMGLIDKKVDIDKLIFHDNGSFLSDNEEDYLRKRPEIKICVNPDSLPFSAIENGKFVGIGSDILDLTRQNAKIFYKLVPTYTQEESFKKIARKECDILPIVKYSKKEKRFKYTSPYHYEPLVVVTDKLKDYILDIDTVLDKEFAVIKDSLLIESLKERYPSIKLNYVNSLKEGFRGVEEGKYYGYIDTLITAAYAFKNIQNTSLKISGQFNDKVGISFGVRDDDKVLFDIFEKFSKNIDHSDIHKFFNEWVSINYIKSVKFEYLKEIMFVVFLIAFLIFYKHNVLKKKNIELEKLKDELLKLNQTLESKVSSAVNEIQKKDTYMLHKSRLAQMGETVSMIAHQWKQPLNAISTIHISIIMAIELEKYNLCNEKEREEFLKFLDEKLKKIGFYTQNLSRIVSDFSNFYKPNKYQEESNLSYPVLQAYGLLEESLAVQNIDLCFELESTSKIMLYKNEFVQAVLNIINNSREQFDEQDINDAQIHIKTYDKEEAAVMEISDNAGGIKGDIIDKIFDPYFSTKFDKNGTGLGLHMTKNIVEQHRGARIFAQNIEDGVKFTIEIGLNRERDEK